VNQKLVKGQFTTMLMLCFLHLQFFTQFSLLIWLTNYLMHNMLKRMVWVIVLHCNHLMCMSKW